MAKSNAGKGVRHERVVVDRMDFLSKVVRVAETIALVNAIKRVASSSAVSNTSCTGCAIACEEQHCSLMSINYGFEEPRRIDINYSVVSDLVSRISLKYESSLSISINLGGWEVVES